MPRQYPLVVLGLTILTTFAFLAHGAEETDALRATLFKEAKASLSEANLAQANVYAPESYGGGVVSYREAEDLLKSGGSIDAIRPTTDKKLPY